MNEATPEGPAIEAQVALVIEATRRANVFKTHRNLFMMLMIISVMKIAMALNFFWSRPTFNPYGMRKEVIGSIFLGFGVAQIVFLTLYRDLRLVRLTLAAAISFLLFWGVSTTESAFDGRSSFQLPILYVFLAALQFPLLFEPAVTVRPIANGEKIE